MSDYSSWSTARPGRILHYFVMGSGVVAVGVQRLLRGEAVCSESHDFEALNAASNVSLSQCWKCGAAT